MKTNNSLVKEFVVDAYGCAENLSDAVQLEKEARKAAESVGATVAEVACHRFQPHGLTLCLILKESHLVVSTWPEHSLAIVNIFLCNNEMNPAECWAVLRKYLKPQQETVHWVSHRIGPAAKKKKLKAA